MASLLIPQAEPPAPAPVRPRGERGRRRRERGRFDAFPFDPVARWALRAGFAAPYAVVGFLYGESGVDAPTGNSALRARLDAIPYGSTRIEDIAAFYPPISGLVGMVLPGALLGLGIAGALVAGFFLQKMLEIMVQREMPRSTTALFLLALAAGPLFAYMAVGNLALLLGLAFFGVGLSQMVRFVVWGSTQSGFVAGLLFMLAALSDAGAILYVATVAATAPFLRWSRSGQPGVRLASVFVLLFPTLSSFGALVLLELLFRVNPVDALAPMLADTPARTERLLTVVLPSVDGLLLVAPVLAAWVIALVVRRPGAMIASTLVFASILAGFCIGLVPSSSAGSTFMLMMLLAIALIPRAGRGYATWIVNAVLVGQIAVAWATALQRDVVVEWLAAVARGVANVLG
jgi:hypothetical protein